MRKINKSIAVILFGQPRFVESKIASRKLKYWARGAKVDFFGHCWFDNETELYDTAPWANLGKIPMDKSAVDKISKQYPGIVLSVEKPINFDTKYFKEKLNLKKGEALRHTFIKEIDNLNNTASQFLSIHRAIQVFENFSQEKKYDIVIITRFDNFIWKMQRPVYFPKDKLTLSNHHSGFPDLIFAGDIKFIRALDVWPNFNEIIKNERNLSAEYLKQKNFLKIFSNQHLNPIESDITILRSSKLAYLFFYLPYMRLRRKLKIKTRIKKSKMTRFFRHV